MNSLKVANYFLSKAKEDGELITNLKMQKMLYYAQAWHLVFFKQESLFNERIEAWQYGPVVIEAYDKLKKYKDNPVKIIEEHNNLDGLKNKTEFLDAIYNTYVTHSAHELVNLTHNESPWRQAFERENKEILNQDMFNFYNNMLINQKSA